MIGLSSRMTASLGAVTLVDRPLWTPADIDTIGWWDPSDASTITTGGGEVTTLADKSGVAPDLTAVAGFGPATGTYTLNGHNMFYYDGTEAMATYSADFALPSSGNYAVLQVSEVFLNLSNTADGMFAMLDGGGTDWQFVGGEAVTNFTGRIVVNELGGTNTNASPRMGVGGAVYCVEFDYDSSTITMFASGNDVGGTTYTIKASSPQTFITMSNRVGNALAGHGGEIVIIEDLAQRVKLNASLCWKYGLQGQLPAGDPYKNAAPTA